ncbi:hypothetical protein CEY12_00880 [Chryseobacterium sp. T16E-39]|uniref:tetratricopeptide repeat protein n=1 Tax=Chryseobacterium sp. T16E-39 TaxID=2015076 RepID=UPI000B5B350C|nr:tetratricopeptide repeat protein [Chryseobacterium sp. T16E-39]ASK28753.1 hypothetical protein CEY12_00880 [Chryseobacterium sp. T16E-39]
MKKLLLFLWLPLSFYSQKLTTKEIDQKLKQTETIFASGDTEKFIATSLDLFEKAKAIDYSKGKVTAGLNLSYGYNRLNQFKKSIYYLHLLERENTTEDLNTQIDINRLFGNNYYGVKMYDEAIVKYKKNILLASEIKDDSAKIYQSTIAMIDLATTYCDKKSYDSATIFGKRAINILQKKKKICSCFETNLKIATLNLAGVKIKEQKIDSAKYFIKSVQSLPTNLGFYEFKTYKILAQINNAEKKYDSAISYYKKSIELAKKIKGSNYLPDLYLLISDAYHKVGDSKNAQDNLRLYTILNDKIKETEDKNLKDTVQLLVDEKRKPLEAKTEYIINWGLAATVIILLLIIVLVVNRRLHKMQKNILINNINEKENASKALSQKLNLAFDEVIQLAKSDDPSFITRFQEVYPALFPKLISIEPQLQNSELKFCAFIYLNFSTKDIATFTFVQPQSIQIRKNRLRKRLQISSEEDLYIWMKNI